MDLLSPILHCLSRRRHVFKRIAIGREPFTAFARGSQTGLRLGGGEVHRNQNTRNNEQTTCCDSQNLSVRFSALPLTNHSLLYVFEGTQIPVCGRG
jgi:hypothetical protein